MDKQINMTNETKLYKILKIKMKDLEKKKQDVIDKETDEIKSNLVTTNVIKIITKDIEYTNKKKEKKIFQATSIKNKDIRQYHTLLKENEVIRIIKALDLDNNNSLDNNYIFIKDIITVAAKVNVYKDETKEFITIRYEKYDKDKNIKLDAEGKPLITEVIYKRLMANSGNIRNKKITFIREELWEKANEILLCGLPTDMEYPHMSKFNAYYALPSTDSTPVTTPQIVVIDDYKKPITETFDVVRPKLDNKGKKIKDEYTCKAEENFTETIKPFDGAGIIDISLAKVWATELGLYEEKIVEDEEENKTIKTSGYIPSYFQFRALVGAKGNVYVMDIKKYAIDYKRRTGNKALINDVFGNSIEILDKDGNLLRNVILTKSQFKFTDKWKELYGKDGFKKWEEEFNKEYIIDKERNLKYKRTFNIAKYAVNFKDIKKEVLLSYQPLQTLNFNKPQIEAICKPTVDRIKKISTDVDEFLKYRGIVQEYESEQNKKDNILVPQYYKALKKNKNLWNDKFIQDKVQEDIKGFKERSYKGCIIVNGNYQVAIPDLVGLLQYAFGEEVIGCLKAYEVYSRYWLGYKIDKVDIIRFPHISMEHRVASVAKLEFKKDYNWLEYINEGIVTSMYDSIALALNSMDYDGDKIMTISTKEIVDQAEKEMANTITFVDNKEEVPKEDNKEETPKEPVRINNMDKIIETDVMGMSNDIGSVVNQISKLWSIIPKDDKEKKQVQEMIKIMSVIGSLTIDFVKTGIKSPIPPSIIKFINDKEVKKPDFMKWKYTKIAKDERKINRNKRLLNEEKIESFDKTKCTVNKISWHMQKEVKKIKVKISKCKTFNYKKCFLDFNKRAEGYVKTLQTMLELKKEEDKIGYLQNKDTDDFTDLEDNTEQYQIFYEYAKNKLMEIVVNKDYKLDKEKMLDYLIYIATNEEKFKKYDNMNLLWNTWGKELTRRLNDKKLIIKELDEDNIIEKSKELKIKADKKKESKGKVYIDIFKASDKEIKIFDTEIKTIKELRDEKNKRLALTMMVLNKFCSAYEKEFVIANNKKSIKMYNIYHLSEINHKNIEGHLKELKENNIIKFQEKDKGKALSCKVNINNTGDTVATIKDVNEIKKLFKLIA